MELRINRFLARCGLGSRRSVETLVQAGRVRVNGEVERDLSRRILPDRDEVEVDGQRVEARGGQRIFLLHKPVGTVSSLVRQDDRPCLTDLIPTTLRTGQLFHVGRLDHDSSVLLLLSDDGDLAHRLLHPRHPVWKTYEIAVRPALTVEAQERFAAGGVELEGQPCLPARIRWLEDRAWDARYEVQLREGRKRQIRRMVEMLGAKVLALHRTAFGPVELGSLAVGQIREVTPEEAQALRDAAHDPTIDAPAEGA